MEDFAGAYDHDGERVVALPAWSRWRRAEGAWVAWANANLAAMTAEEKLALVEWVFVRTRGTDGVYHAASFAFPGFDRFAFGLSIADAWARAGHPRGGEQPPGQLALFAAVVCPIDVAVDGATSSIGRCDYVWYRDALDDAATTRRLMDALLAHKDLDLVQAVFTAIDFMPAPGDKLASLFSLTHALDADDAAWRRAFRVIADDRAEAGEAPRWTDEARRQWAGHSARHGTLLYALAQVDRYGDGDKVGWDRFGDTFGAPLDARDFGAYLDEGVRAMSLAHVVWPALSPGWSRAAVLVPRLDAYLDDPAARRYDSPGSGERARRHRPAPLRGGSGGGHGPDPRPPPAADRDAPGRGLCVELRRHERVREAREAGDRRTATGDAAGPAGARAPLPEPARRAGRMSRAARRWRVALAALVGCGAASSRPIVVTNDVAIAFTPAAPDVPFDPHAARLAQATRQLTGILGHGVALQVDTALLMPFRSSLEDALADAVEHLTRDVTSLRESRPRAFARESLLLQRVSCRYSALLDHRTARLDAGTLVVAEPATGELLEDGLVQSALDDDYDVWVDATLSALPPDRVPPGDWEDYFEWAIHPASPPDRRARAERTGEVRRRSARAVAPPGDAVRARRGHRRRTPCARRSTRTSSTSRTTCSSRTRTTPRWSATRRPTRSSGAPRRVGRVAQRADAGARRQAEGHPRRAHLRSARGRRRDPSVRAFPGFDAFAFGLGVADAWARAGHPTDAPDGDARFELMDQIVCPVMRRPDGTHDRNRGCAGRWFKLAVEDPALTERLASALGQRDPVLVETIFANFKYDDAGPVVTLWRALAPHPAAWRTASQVVVDELLADGGKKSALVGEAERVWAALPDRRGTALYLMARADEDLDWHYADDRWSTFERRFGAAVTGQEFAAMLDVSPRAIEVASVVWRALSPGWSRGEALAARLDAFLDAWVARSDGGEQPAKAVRAILKRECADSRAADIAQLHAVLVRRASRSPGEGTALGPLVTDTDGRHCGDVTK